MPICCYDWRRAAPPPNARDCASPRQTRAAVELPPWTPNHAAFNRPCCDAKVGELTCHNSLPLANYCLKFAHCQFLFLFCAVLFLLLRLNSCVCRSRTSIIQNWLPQMTVRVMRTNNDNDSARSSFCFYFFFIFYFYFFFVIPDFFFL